MSRSRKKQPVRKDGGGGRKTIAARRIRRAEKIAVKRGDEVLPLTDEITNNWWICDWSVRWDKHENINHYCQIIRK